MGLKEGVKYDQEKPDWSLLELSAVEQVVKVLTHGARKYDRDNWKKVPEARNRYFAAAMRHLTAYQRGEKIDRDSGLPTLAHTMCCLIFLICFDMMKPVIVVPSTTEVNLKREKWL
jgi:hypothetical protein